MAKIKSNTEVAKGDTKKTQPWNPFNIQDIKIKILKVI